MSRFDSQKTGGGSPAATRPEYPVVETSPPLPARRAGYGGTSSDIVEHMQYLYVRVVKAEVLPVDDKKCSSIDPYVEVRVGDLKALTKYFENNLSPAWEATFAFPEQEMIMQNTSSIVVTVWDKKNKAAVGKVSVGMSTVAQRMPHESPLAPEWYPLFDTKFRPIKQAKIMLAVWMGTQADPAFNDAHNTSTRSSPRVYFSPTLHYVRAHIQGVRPPPDDRARVVKVQLGSQVLYTRPSLKKPNGDTKRNDVNEELMFVTSEPFDERIDVSVLDRIEPGKEVMIGSISIPLYAVKQRIETSMPPHGQWYPLSKPKHDDDDNNNKKKKKKEKDEEKPEEKIEIKIGLCIDSGYHVFDESMHFSSDFQPSANHLRKKSMIGVLEVGILKAELQQMNKDREGKKTGGAYCVAKYGKKWVRTRTLINTPRPHWNEQYTWEVFDTCTVITVGVFNDCHINVNNDVNRDQSIGKVRIRLSELENKKTYTLSYQLLVLPASGLKKPGVLHLAVRFTCTSWMNMLGQYRKPLLPKMHYVEPISLGQMDWLRHQAMQIVGEKLSFHEPPLRREIVEYMLDAGDDHMWSLRRSKANYYRIVSLTSWIDRLCTWFNKEVCSWRNPWIAVLVHALLVLLVVYPKLILSTVFLRLFVGGVRNYRSRPRLPDHVDARISQAENNHPDELDEESDRIPTSRKPGVVKMRYERLRSMGGRVQNMMGDLATQGERVVLLLSWRDPRSTSIFIICSLVSAVLLYVVPFQLQAVALVIGFYVLRHPRFRSPWTPPVLLNFFKRLPAKSDSLL